MGNFLEAEIYLNTTIFERVLRPTTRIYRRNLYNEPFLYTMEPLIIRPRHNQNSFLMNAVTMRAEGKLGRISVCGFP